MSRTEHLIGTLKRVEIKNSLEETCKEIINRPLDFYSSYEEWLREDFYGKYYFKGDEDSGVELYKVESEEIDNKDGIFSVCKTEDGYIFELQYYNAGIGFIDALEEAFINLKEDEQVMIENKLLKETLELLNAFDYVRLKMILQHHFSKDEFNEDKYFDLKNRIEKFLK